MLVTTLNKIKECKPCESGWKMLLNHLGKKIADDEPLPFLTILESNGFVDALWCTRCAPEYDKEWRLFGVWCVRKVQNLLIDPRSLDALDVSERFANGLASQDELSMAWAAARDAASYAASSEAWDAAWAAARDAASSAAWAAARNASRDAQKAQFIKIITK